ncbi:MAG TPA: hypothetical protein VGP41_09145 [Candidatus Lustribacter sp.]|nr:hypothetical protein [Candidatus Lustribacter sp.]
MQANKVEAIYALRDAAEAKAAAEHLLENKPTAANRELLLDAQLELEAKTQDAIEVCHECGLPHAANDPHPERGANVIDVDFGDRS